MDYCLPGLYRPPLSESKPWQDNSYYSFYLAIKKGFISHVSHGYKKGFIYTFYTAIKKRMRNPSKLTDQQQQFCHAYLRTFNGTDAYQSVYRSKSRNGAGAAASELLRNPKIQRHLSELRERISNRSEATLERTLAEISRVAFADITDVLSFSDRGLSLKDSDNLADDVTAAIESVTIHETVTENGTTRKQSVKLHNKMTALGYLADYFGLRDDFNKARATLKRYGLAVVPDAESDIGWKIEAYHPSNAADAA